MYRICFITISICLFVGGNSFSGDIPSELGGLPVLGTLDLGKTDVLVRVILFENITIFVLCVLFHTFCWTCHITTYLNKQEGTILRVIFHLSSGC